LRLAVTVVIFMMLAVPAVMATTVQVFPVSTQVSSVLTIRNPLAVNLSVAVYMGYNVTAGVNGSKFRLTFKPDVYLFKNWTSGAAMALPYTINCSKPGNYTLSLLFKGIGTDGKIYRFTIPVRFRIVRIPVRLSAPVLYVQGSPVEGSVFNGENVTASVSVTNLASIPVPVRVWMTVLNGSSSVLLKEERSLTLLSGHRTVGFSFVVPWSWSRGRYRVMFRVISEYGNVSSSRDFTVSPGVSLVNVSLQKSEVFVGQRNTLYVALLSQRPLRVNLTVNGRVVKSLELEVGSSLVEVPVNATKPGLQRLGVEVLHDGLVLGSTSLSYLSLSPPFFAGVNASSTGREVSLNITIVNPNNTTVSVELLGNISGVVTAPHMPLILKPGRTVVHLNFTGVKPNSTVHFKLELISSSLVLASKTGTVRVPPLQGSSGSSEANASSSATSSTFSFSTSVTGQRTAVGWRWAGAIAALAVVVAFAVGVTLRSRRRQKEYVSPWERARKPHVRRKRPSRRSPLGMFRRPKPPEPREGKELPKLGEKKRTGTGRDREGK